MKTFAQIQDPKTLNSQELNEMFSLFEKNYDNTCFQRFTRKFKQEATHIILIRESRTKAIIGFQRFQIMNTQYKGKNYILFYSGTVIKDARYYGEKSLPKATSKLFMKTRFAHPRSKLIFVAMFNGWKTFLYVHRFLPCFPYAKQSSLGNSVAKGLLQHVGLTLYGEENYDTKSNIVHRAGQENLFKEDEIAQLPKNYREIPELAWFVKNNPNYRSGDEILSICELSYSLLFKATLRLGSKIVKGRLKRA